MPSPWIICHPIPLVGMGANLPDAAAIIAIERDGYTDIRSADRVRVKSSLRIPDAWISAVSNFPDRVKTAIAPYMSIYDTDLDRSWYTGDVWISWGPRDEYGDHIRRHSAESTTWRLAFQAELEYARKECRKLDKICETVREMQAARDAAFAAAEADVEGECPASIYDEPILATAQIETPSAERPRRKIRTQQKEEQLHA
jgi:hypothetical protein